MKGQYFIYIGIGFLAILVALDYWNYNNKITNAQKTVDSIMRVSKESVIREKDRLIESIEEDKSKVAQILSKKFNLNSATKTRHKVVKTVLFDKSLKYKVYQQSYIHCLYDKCKVKNHNDSILNMLNNEISLLRINNGVYVDEWYNKIGRAKFISTSNVIEDDCKKYFNENVKIQLVNGSIVELENFIKKLRDDKLRAKQSEERSLRNYKRYLRKAEMELNSTGESYLINNFSKYSSIKTDSKEFTYRGDVLGQINYELTFSEFNDKYYYDVIEQAKIEQYKNNSLSTGAMPYGYCYGFDNSCEGWGCSEIRIITSLFNDDLIITIKRNDEVVRHSYIEEGDSYTFNVPNGTYQTFFYSGSGWHPEKFMKYTSCGELEGGFIDNENVGKDDPQYLNNQVLTYELRLQRNGNFSKEPSNINEAF